MLAAGRGTRFAEDSGRQIPKVLRPLAGKPVIRHVLDVLAQAGVSDVAVVVGFGADRVRSALGERFAYAVQREQKGSGDAVRCARGLFADAAGCLVVMCGDSPLFLPETIRRMVECHRNTGASVTLAAARMEDPTGYGRILRGENGAVAGIVEEKCANALQRAVREVNGGAYVFDTRWLFDNIGLIAENAAGEYNLTDTVRVAVEQGRTISCVACGADEIGGVNTPAQLAAAEAVLAGRRSA